MGNAANQQLWQADDNFDQAMPLDPGTTYFEDSRVYYNPAKVGSDGITGKILPCRNDTNAAYEVGVLRDLNPVQIYDVTQTPNQPSSLARVSRRGQYLFYATAGDSITPFLPCYSGVDEQTITTVAGTNKIGYIDPQQPIISSATAGQQVLVQYRAKYPAEDAI